jgi:uncharacterized phiE125 gp8 family phage protein
VGALVETGVRLALETAPAADPLTVAQLREHLRIVGSHDDDLLSAYLDAAVKLVAEEQGRALITQTWNWTLQDWPGGTGAICVPKPPLQSVTHVKYVDGNGTLTTIDSANYQVDTSGTFGAIVPASGYCWPGVNHDYVAPIQIQFVAGYGDAGSDVPETTRVAIRQLVAGWYEHREPVVIGRIVSEVPNQVERLIAHAAVIYGGPDWCG